MIIKPKVRGFMCVTTHPVGCDANVKEQIDYVKSQGEITDGPKRVLVIGSSTGYGLASRITAAFGSGVPQPLVCSSRKRVLNESLVRQVGITPQHSTSMLKRKACMRKVLMAMHSLMRLNKKQLR